jgi:hypothetical protein
MAMKIINATHKVLLLLTLLFFYAITTNALAQMNHSKYQAGKVELGTSAAVDQHGRFWVISKEPIGNDNRGFITLKSSKDMGKTWTAPKRTQLDPEAISADGENRPKLSIGKDDEIYISYTKPLTKPYTGEIRFIRSTDSGQTFSKPITVHANKDEITHRFESMIVDMDGNIYIAWIDKRDVEAAQVLHEKYRGAAIYYAVSKNKGASFDGDFKISDHSCECCRIALSLNENGKPVAMWRQIFEPNIRDHAVSILTIDGNLDPLTRVTFDNWKVDACPHHGPSLAFSSDGIRHQTWFNVKDDEGGIFYAATNADGTLGIPVKLGSAQAAHSEVLLSEQVIAIVWKEFGGKLTTIVGKISYDAGVNWKVINLVRTQGNSDQPHLYKTQKSIALLWRTQNEGVNIISLGKESIQ